MNHIGSKTRRGFDPAPLPQFQLPAEPVVDPSDVAETVERKPVSIDRARKIVRRRTLPPPSADSTQDVAPEDILLEAYAEPPTKRMLPDLVSDEVDELLRASDPPPVPSIAPLAVAIGPAATPAAAFVPPPAEVAPRPAPAAKRSSHGALVALALFVSGVAVTAAIVFLVPASTFARAKASARALVDRAPAPPPPPAKVEPASPAPPPPAVVTAPAPAVVDSAPVVPVDALPKPIVPANTTLVTLPPSAVGHRVYVDDVVLPDGASPAKMKCGKRTIRIGSQGKPREVDLPCGRDYVLR